jgi:TolB-like protein
VRLLWLTVLLGLPVWARAGEPKRLAVLELRDQAGLAAQEAQYLADVVRAAAAARLPRSGWLVMTRESLLALLPPGTDLAKCEGDCEVETGRNLGADYVVSGEVVRFGEHAGLRVLLKLHDTAGGALLGTERASAEAVDDLEKSVQTAADALFARLGAASEAGAPAFASGMGAAGGAFGDVDVELLGRLQAARNAERNADAKPRDKAAAWSAVAERAGDADLGRRARERADAWTAFAVASEERQARIDAARGRYRDDRERLDKLLALDDAVASPESKARWRAAFDEAWKPWRPVFEEEARRACAGKAAEAPSGWLFALIDLVPYYREALLVARHFGDIGVEPGVWTALAVLTEGVMIGGLVTAVKSAPGSDTRRLGLELAIGGYAALPLLDLAFAELTLPGRAVERCREQWLGACPAAGGAPPAAFGVLFGFPF